MKKIAILGATGSIGRQALDIIEKFPGRFKVTAMTTHRNSGLLLELAEEIRRGIYRHYRPQRRLGVRENRAKRHESRLWHKWAAEIVQRGRAGYSAYSRRRDSRASAAYRVPRQGHEHSFLRTRNRWSAAGILSGRRCSSRSRRFSLWTASCVRVYQCLGGLDTTGLKRVILTASGGPFLGWSREQIRSATVEQALRHPNWRMGKKVTVDCATYMNKGLEIIETKWLFGISPDMIDVIIHRQSIIHSMIEFIRRCGTCTDGADGYAPADTVCTGLS